MKKRWTLLLKPPRSAACAASGTGDYRPDLVMSLINLAAELGHAARHEEGLAAAAEAVELSRNWCASAKTRTFPTWPPAC